MMVELTAILLQFAEKGEKTGWTYLSIPADVAQEIKPDNKLSFRVKGFLDGVPISGLALLPMGEGEFILPVKAVLRKALGKQKGAMVKMQLEEDKDFKITMPDDLAACFTDEPEALHNFNQLPKSHQHYYFKWINGAKTEATRVKRIAATLNASSKGLGYGEMMREMKAWW
ncbi:MAG: YdeI/OmpD-associated family protein [Mucilaginibacter sp.]|uniref:YdeI/OmpD-associated family protein n=1 Tax=Mucilaginibacter sp. TaxID=1882438 RepID=UPI0034E39EDB